MPKALEKISLKKFNSWFGVLGVFMVILGVVLFFCELKIKNNAIYIYVKVLAGAKKESLKQKSKDHFEVSVREKAEHNLANKRVLELLASYFKLPVSKVRIINGHRHPSKLIVIED